MSIKVTIDEDAPVKEKPFPKMMVSQKGRVVLFCEEGDGVVLTCGCGAYKTGNYVTNWCMDLFEDFTGTITMECN